MDKITLTHCHFTSIHSLYLVIIIGLLVLGSIHTVCARRNLRCMTAYQLVLVVGYHFKEDLLLRQKIKIFLNLNLNEMPLALGPP